MRLTIKLLLAWFAFFGLAIGAWQQFAPASFYADFPGLGHHWVSPDGQPAARHAAAQAVGQAVRLHLRRRTLASVNL